MRTFEFRDDNSAKFWNIELQGRSFTGVFRQGRNRGPKPRDSLQVAP
jgi:predicted DNA-binding WGR domain protein